MLNGQLVRYNSLRNFYLWAGVGLILTLVGGYIIAQWNFPVTEDNIVLVIVAFLPLAFAIAFLDFYLGWRAKRGNLEYSPPTWEFAPVQMTIEDAKRLPKEYTKKNSRIVAIPNFWYYFIPFASIMFSAMVPMYTITETTILGDYIPLIYPALLAIIHLVSYFGSWRSTSCAASGDFTLPLIREAVNLADIQSKVTGISHTRVVFDKAEADGYELYRNPRVVSRVTSLEESAYIESNTEELAAVSKVLIRSYKVEELPEVIWWWSAQERIFRKYVGDSQEGYFVKSPVPSRTRDLGVKDVKLIFQNAVAILALERIRLLGPTDELKSIITSLGIELQ
jgi:hypothetical protein